MKRIKIAVIDGGFDFRSSLVNRITEYKNFSQGSDFDEYGHGTSVVRIIDGKCKDCDLYIFKVWNTNIECEFRNIEAAMYYAIEREVDIINASFGVESDKYEKQIEKLCYELYKKNIILINTRSNNGCKNYLYENDNVLKVIGGKNIRDNQIYYRNEVYFILGMARMIPWLEDHYVLKGGNSFSLPLMVPHVAKGIKNGCKGLKEIKNFLKKESVWVNDETEFYKYPVIKKQIPLDETIYNIIKEYMEKNRLAMEDNRILKKSYFLYRIEEILSDMRNIFQYDFSYELFQYPDLYFVENLTNRIYHILNGGRQAD